MPPFDATVDLGLLGNADVATGRDDSLLPLQVSELRLARAGRELLNGVGFTLQPGHVTALLGPNGAGKTLLLRLLCGLLEPDEGRVEWHGRTPRAAMSRVGMVLQKPVMLRRSARANI